MIAACSPLDLFDWLGEVNASPDLPPSAKSVALAVARYINSKTGLAWPSHARLASDTSTSTPTIKRALALLREAGHLHIEPGIGRRTSRYRAILRGFTSDPSEGSPVTHELEKELAITPPPPSAGVSVEIAAEPSAAATSAPQPPAEPATLPEVPAAAEAPQSAAEAALDPDDFCLVIGYINAILGTNHPTRPVRGDRGHRNILTLLRRGHCIEDMKAVFDYCRSTWSSPRLLTPSAVFRPDTFAEKLQAAKASVRVQRAAAHRPFAPEPQIKRADPAAARAGLHRLREAMAGRFAA